MRATYLDTDHTGNENLTLVSVRYTRRQFVLIDELLSGEDDFQAAQAFVRIVATSHELIGADLQQPEFEMPWSTVAIRITIPAF